MRDSIIKISILIVFVVGCASEPTDFVVSPVSESVPEAIPSPKQTQIPVILPTELSTQEAAPMTESFFADVIAIKATGAENAYQFNVQISSPDTGCEQYADWWEVLSEDGQLLYRRVLLHSHVNEQPFTRSGGPVPVVSNTVVIVRAHMNNGGYGGAALRGSASSRFETVQLESGFAAEVEALDPLPGDCAF